MNVTGYPVYEDSDHVLLANWLFRLSSGRFGSLTIFVRAKSAVFPVNGFESAYLRRVVGHLAARGISLGHKTLTNEMFCDFIEAVLSRGGYGWQAYFATKSPEARAEEIVSVG